MLSLAIGCFAGGVEKLRGVTSRLVKADETQRVPDAFSVSVLGGARCLL